MIRGLSILLSFLISISVTAQINVSGKVTNTVSQKPEEGVQIFLKGSSLSTITNTKGEYSLRNLGPGQYQITVYLHGFQTQTKDIILESGDYTFDFELGELKSELEEVVVTDKSEGTTNISRLKSVEGTSIYESKKNEVIILSNLVANLSTNNARQIFAKVPGLNIWESDGAGLQLGIGARGLDPSRTSNFNVRQNGYDISADALGYPESYYTPPSEALERIEVVRGASSLQYGTQFGGLLNFVLKRGPKDKVIELTSRLSGGSFGLFNAFNSIGGTSKKVNYYTFFQHKQGNGWRPNSEFDLNMGYASITYSPSDRASITWDFTKMNYLTKQPGGLTDAQFYQDPRQSRRSRNWFRVDWNLMALSFDYRLSDHLKFNTRTFGLIGGRDALGNLGRIDRDDDYSFRDLFIDDFKNIGNETRFIYTYSTKKQSHVLLIGTRYYKGSTHRVQGIGPDGSRADFRLLNEESEKNSDFRFPGNNFSVFAENIFNLSDRLSLTPGLRVERIETKADGYYHDSVLKLNPDTGLAEDSIYRVDESKKSVRSFVIAGLGASFRQNENLEWYANISQNYRSINFNDIRVINPNMVVDSTIHDEKGYNADFGIRGNLNAFNFDVSIFYLSYNGRIGQILKVDETNFRTYRFRTNVADSRHIGIEFFGQVDILKLFNQAQKNSLIFFTNVSVTDARYTKSKETSIQGKKVELVPPVNIKSGISFNYQRFQTTCQVGYTARHFSDASNTVSVASAVEGEIPAYFVMDLSSRYQYKWFSIEGGINNLLDAMYFTRRAAGYPGPGILPSDGRSFYITLQVKLSN
jgi:Fe(3+) dicitrate transport protein